MGMRSPLRLEVQGPRTVFQVFQVPSKSLLKVVSFFTKSCKGAARTTAAKGYVEQQIKHVLVARVKSKGSSDEPKDYDIASWHLWLVRLGRLPR